MRYSARKPNSPEMTVRKSVKSTLRVTVPKDNSKTNSVMSCLTYGTPKLIVQNLRCCNAIVLLGKRKHTPPCSSAELFFAEKRGPQRKDFGGGYGFPAFYRVFVSTTGLEKFSLHPEKFPKRFSFGGGRVRFLLLCLGMPQMALQH